ncbi:MAG TPA: hypothetical protein VND67_11110 [Acidimicrobiales bacterium]|nr:hypothetical protein [Acidimicrobiales bacterium]
MIDVVVCFLVIALFGFGPIGLGIGVLVVALIAVLARAGRRSWWRRQQGPPPVPVGAVGAVGAVASARCALNG